MKNTKTMAILAVFLSFAVLIGTASALVATTDADQAPIALINASGDEVYTVQYPSLIDPTHNTSVAGNIAANTQFIPTAGGAALIVDGGSNITVKNTTATGLYSASIFFPQVTYRVEVVSNASDVTDGFAPVGNEMVRYVFSNTPANLKFPDGTYMPAGTVFTNTAATTQTFTLTNGDGYMTGQAVGNYTTTVLGGSATVYLKVAASAAPESPDYEIRDVASGSGAFFFLNITFY